MKVREKKWIRYRIYFVTFCFLVAFGIILFRAYQLQIIDQDKLAKIAREDYRVTVKLPPKRGTIYDREGHELAVSIEVESVLDRRREDRVDSGSKYLKEENPMQKRASKAEGQAITLQHCA